MFGELSAEQMVSKAKVALMSDPDWKWLASILMLGNLEFVDGADAQVPTAATDGLNEIYNRDFLAKLTPNQVKFVVLHENMHKVFRHLYVWQTLFEENPMLANIACDAVINTQYLYGKQGLDMVPDSVHIPKYEDKSKWNAKAIFDDLKQSLKDPKPKSRIGSGGTGHDSHQWEKAKSVSTEEAKEIEKQVDAALRQAAIAGDLSKNMPREVKDMLVPSVDWRNLLSEFVKASATGEDKRTWRKPHKTYLAYDLYIPAPYSENVGRILVANDTSGSIDDDMLSVIMGHVQVLCDEVNPDGLDIVWWDTEVRGVDSFERGALDGLASKVKPRGGGGTTPACITDWMSKEYRNECVCAIVVTDGEFYGDSVGEWGDVPVIWLVINPYREPNISVGTTIHVREL